MRVIPGVSLHWPGETRAQILASPGDKIVSRWRAAHKNNGWQDIGYHYIVHRDEQGTWRVYPGRLDSLAGAHSGTNAGNQYLGINVAYGTDEQLPQEAVQVLSDLIQDLSKKYGFAISAKSVLGHRDFVATQCPGEPLYREIPGIIKSLLQKPAQQAVNQLKTTVTVRCEGAEVQALLLDGKTMLTVEQLHALGLISGSEWDGQTRTVELDIRP